MFFSVIERAGFFRFVLSMASRSLCYTSVFSMPLIVRIFQRFVLSMTWGGLSHHFDFPLALIESSLHLFIMSFYRMYPFRIRSTNGKWKIESSWIIFFVIDRTDLSKIRSVNDKRRLESPLRFSSIIDRVISPFFYYTIDRMYPFRIRSTNGKWKIESSCVIFLSLINANDRYPSHID